MWRFPQPGQRVCEVTPNIYCAAMPASTARQFHITLNLQQELLSHVVYLRNQCQNHVALFTVIDAKIKAWISLDQFYPTAGGWQARAFVSKQS